MHCAQHALLRIQRGRLENAPEDHPNHLVNGLRFRVHMASRFGFALPAVAHRLAPISAIVRDV